MGQIAHQKSRFSQQLLTLIMAVFSIGFDTGEYVIQVGLLLDNMGLS